MRKSRFSEEQIVRIVLEHEAGVSVRDLSRRHVLPKEFRTNVLAGWHTHLDFLAEALDGQAVNWPRWPFDRW